MFLGAGSVVKAGVLISGRWAPAVLGDSLSATFYGNNGSNQIYYTESDLAAPVTSISVYTGPTFGSISIVDTAIFYITPCNISGKDEIDTFSLLFDGAGGSTIVPVTVTVTPY
jgi:hypothetical protein